MVLGRLVRRRPLALLVGALVAALLAPAAPGAAAIVSETYYVPSVGGALIRVAVSRDAAETNVPVVLTYSPYNSRRDADNVQLLNGTPPDLATRGYAQALADVLGTRGSDGCWDYGGLEEQQSGADVVKFLAGKKADHQGKVITWSSGSVAMIGGSYDGTTANMVAALGDKVSELKAIVPIVAISRWHSYAYSQGLRYTVQSPNGAPGEQGIDTPLVFDFGYGKTVAADPNAPNAAAVAEDRVSACRSVEHMMAGYDESPDYNQFWRERDYLKDADKFRAAVLIGGGWQDYNVKQEESINLYNALPVDDPATAGVEGVPFKMLAMGQNAHAEPAGLIPGWSQLVNDFLDWQMLGKPQSARLKQPAYTVGRTGSGGSFQSLLPRREDAWPPVGTADVSLHLADSAGAGTVTATAPAASAATLVDAGVGDEFRALQDVTKETDWLLYASAPLAADTRMAGEATLHAVLSSTRDRAALTPLLVDLGPGTEAALPAARGFANLQYRDGLAAAKPVPIGTPFSADVVMKPQDYTFKKGHRIGVLVMGSNVDWARPEGPQQLTVHHGAAGTTLILPVVNPPADPAALFQ